MRGLIGAALAGLLAGCSPVQRFDIQHEWGLDERSLPSVQAHQGGLLLAAPRWGAALFFLAEPLRPAWRLPPPPPPSPSLLGTAAGWAGDLDGDGAAEAYVSDPRRQPRAAVTLYKSSSQAGLKEWRTILSPGAGDGFGEAIAAAGDLDGDGFDDLAVADFAWHGHRGRVLVYRGGASGPSVQPAWALEGEQPGDWFGYSLCGPGDLDGDGYADLVISGKNCSGACTLWLSDDPRFEIHRRYVATQAAEDAAGTAKAGRLSVFFGGPDGPGAGLQREGEHPHAFYGFKLAAAGDLDRDGLPDLAVSAPGWMARRGRVEVLSLRGRQARVLAVMQGNADGAELGQSLGAPGDLDGDGLPELAAGSVRGGDLWLWWGWDRQRKSGVDLRAFAAPGLQFSGGPEALGSGRFAVAGRRAGQGVVMVMGASGKRL